MKYIKIFVASSIVEFSSERQELCAFVNNLNKHYVKNGLFFELTVCEDLSNAISLERKQEEYNREIRDSQFFYIIFGRSAGAYTVEEFDVAFDSFQLKGSPSIYTFFKRYSEDEADQSIKDFMNRLDKDLGHYFSVFDHIDSVKLNMLIELTRAIDAVDDVVFEDGRALLNESPVINLEAIPLYCNNTNLSDKREELDKLNELFASTLESYGKNPSDASLLTEIEIISNRRAKLLESIHELESNLLALYKNISALRGSDEESTWRTKKASDLLEVGNYDAALAILRDAQRGAELEQAKRLASEAIERIQGYIAESRLRAKTLLASRDDAEAYEEAEFCYSEIIDLAFKYSISYSAVFDYAKFLFIRQRIPEALEIAKRLYMHADQLNEEELFGNKTALLNFLGLLSLQVSDFDSAEKYYEEELAAISNSPSSSERETLELAMALNDLGSTKQIIGKVEDARKQLSTAEQLYKKLLHQNRSNEIYIQGAIKNANAIALNAALRSDESKARRYCDKARTLSITRLDGSSDTFDSIIGDTLSLQGVVFSEINSQAECLDALRNAFYFYKRSLRSSTTKLEPFVGIAITLADVASFEESARCLLEAATTIMSCEIIDIANREECLDCLEAKYNEICSNDSCNNHQAFRDAIKPQIGTSPSSLMVEKVFCEPKRGAIRDRNWKTLAECIDSKTIFANPREVHDVDKTAEAIASVLGGERDSYCKLLSNNGSFVFIKRKADVQEARKLEMMDLDGVHFIDDTKRVYPYGQIAGQVAGASAVTVDEQLHREFYQGFAGLELFYDEALAGSPGYFENELDEFGELAPHGRHIVKNQTDGKDLVVSIDVGMQRGLEEVLEDCLNNVDADSGSAILMNYRNGEILAAASLPYFNPADRSKVEQGSMALKPITQQFEPGHIMSAASVLAMLEKGSVNLETTLECPTSYQVDGYVISDDTELQHIELSLEQAFLQSSNVGISMFTEKELGFKNLYDTIAKYELINPTGVDYPGEKSGYMLGFDRWSRVQGLNVSFGQGYSMSLLQIVSFYCAIANRGKRVVPHFAVHQAEARNRVLSHNTQMLKTLEELLVRSASYSPDIPSTIEGLEVAGKASIAPVFDSNIGKYRDDCFNKLAIGWIPNAANSLMCALKVDNTSKTQIIKPIFERLLKCSQGSALV